MYNENSSNPMLTNVTFNGNTASIGGGMYNNITSNPTLTNVTFSGNSADGNGGGMYNVNSSPTLTNVTFSGNSASQKGGGMYNTSGSPTIRNTIFWSNTASSAGAQIFNNGSSSVVSDSVVLAGCPAGSTCTNIIITDPKLGPLGNYGGSNQTIPLLPGSSAIDTGNDAFCPATDQRGVARPQGAHCDIGAYEYYEVDTTAPVVNSITRLNPSPTNLASVGFTVTFSESVTGVDVSDFVLTTAGISGASVTGVSGLGSVYTVTVDTGSGTGTLRLDVTDDDSIVDMAGNPLGGTGTGNGNFTSGETYDVRFHLIYLPLVLRNWP
jgi:predicted outer membrane repeat protein